jgi:predicted nucleic acid-binding protein
MSIRIIATLFIAAALCLVAFSYAQNTHADKSNESQVEVKTDRFSNLTTVSLKPQTIIDEAEMHLLTMQIDAKLEKKNVDDVFRDQVNAIVQFKSHSQGGVDFGDYKIHFLVDGHPLNVPPGKISVIGGLTPKQGFKIYRSGTILLNREALEKIRKADRIEVRFGAIELTLNASALTTMRDYAEQTLAQQKAINGR